MIDYRLLSQRQNLLRIAVGKSNHLLHHQLQEVGWKQLYALQESSSFAELPRDTKKNLEPSEFCHLRLILLKQFLALQFPSPSWAPFLKKGEKEDPCRKMQQKCDARKHAASGGCAQSESRSKKLAEINSSWDGV